MAHFTATEEYVNRRRSDEAQERELRGLLEEIYAVHGYDVTYNTVENSKLTGKKAEMDVIDKEKRGFDVQLSKNGKSMILDEKAYLSKKDAFDSAKTYAFEVSTQNNKNGQGWLFKEDAMNSHYALIYPEQDENGKIQKLEILLVNKEKLMSVFADKGIGTRQDAEAFLEANGKWGTDDRTRAYVDDMIKIVHTGNSVLTEEPTNIVVNRALLRTLSDDIIKETDMNKVHAKYQMIQQSKENRPKPKEAQKEPVQRGIRFRKNSLVAIQKASRNNPKLRNVQLPEFLPAPQYADSYLGKNTNVHISEYATYGKSVILQGMAGGLDKRVQVICGKEIPPDISGLYFKDLPYKQQFTLSGDVCEKQGEKYLENKKELAPVNDISR